jgi:hypothetical protein
MPTLLDVLPHQERTTADQQYLTVISRSLGPLAAGTSLAADTLDVVQESLEGTAQDVLPSLIDIHAGVFAHQFRTAAMGLAVARAACGSGLGKWRQAEVVNAMLWHDFAKWDPTILPLVDHPGYFTDAQRALMGRHAALGEEQLSLWSDRLLEGGYLEAGLQLGFAARVAGGHSNYGTPFPRTGDPEDQWRWEVTEVCILLDNVDALTSTGEQRPYRAQRQAEGDGGRSALSVIDERLGQWYGSSRDEPFPITGLSPETIAVIALTEKATTFREMSLN